MSDSSDDGVDIVKDLTVGDSVESSSDHEDEAKARKEEEEV